MNIDSSSKGNGQGATRQWGNETTVTEKHIIHTHPKMLPFFCQFHSNVLFRSNASAFSINLFLMDGQRKLLAPKHQSATSTTMIVRTQKQETKWNMYSTHDFDRISSVKPVGLCVRKLLSTHECVGAYLFYLFAWKVLQCCICEPHPTCVCVCVYLSLVAFFSLQFTVSNDLNA